MKQILDQLVPIVKRKRSYHGGESARPFFGQRGTVGHRRLVNDVVEARTWDIVLKGKNVASPGHTQFHCAFSQALQPLTLSLLLIR